MLAQAEHHEVEQSRATREKIDVMQRIMAAMPQAPGMETTHFFAGGMYCRRIAIPAGRIIVSKVHKTEHLFIGCVGELAVAGQGQNYTIRPGDVVPSPVGTKRVVAALTDVVVMTIHRTDVESVEQLESDLMEDDGLSLYDVNNQPKPGVLVGVPSKEALEK